MYSFYKKLFNENIKKKKLLNKYKIDNKIIVKKIANLKYENYVLKKCLKEKNKDISWSCFNILSKND